MISNELFDQFANVIADKVAAKLAAHQKPAKRLLTARETAEYIGRSPEAVKQMTARGELPTVRAGRRVHYDLAALDHWIAENTIQ